MSPLDPDTINSSTHMLMESDYHESMEPLVRCR